MFLLYPFFSSAVNRFPELKGDFGHVVYLMLEESAIIFLSLFFGADAGHTSAGLEVSCFISVEYWNEASSYLINVRNLIRSGNEV